MIRDIDHREIKKQNQIHKKLKYEGVFKKLNILDESATENDISIDLDNMLITVNSDITIYGFMSYMYTIWYSKDKLQRRPFPLKLHVNNIITYDGWEIENEDKILISSDIQNMWIKKQRQIEMKKIKNGIE